MSFRKTNIHVAIIIVLLFLVAFLTYREVSTSRKMKVERMAATIDTIIQYKTLAGKTAYKVYEKQVQDKFVVDSLSKELKIKNKEIEKYVSIISSSDYKNVKAVGKDTVYLDKDSVPRIGKYGEFRDGYIDVAAFITDSLRFVRFKTTDTLTAVFQRTKIGGETFNKLIVTNKSPYSHIVGLEDIKIKEEPRYRRWSLGASAGVTVPTWKPYVGIGINYDIIRFRKK